MGSWNKGESPFDKKPRPAPAPPAPARPEAKPADPSLSKQTPIGRAR